MKNWLWKISTVVTATLLTSCAGNTAHKSKEVVQETYIHKYGITVTEEDWDRRGRDGQIVSTLRDGVTLTRSYSGGNLDGNTTYSFPHSQIIQKTETYNRGQLVRIVTNFSSGSPMKEESNLNAAQKEVRTWYEQGTPKSVETWEGKKLLSGEYFTLDNQTEATIKMGSGTRIQRDAFGQRTSEDEFHDGQIAKSTTFHLNGTPKEITPYENGVIHGMKKLYTPGGEPEATEQWHQGTQVGLTTLYQNGEKIAEVPYQNNKKQGTELRFKNGSLVVQEINWRNNSKHGPTKTFFENDTKTTWFYDGRLVSKIEFEGLSRGEQYR
ncbi:MAG: hypothetical protein CMO81_05160 [Waddliaceae bacterium]|nr:hypothetical protein [Waddliaceae bacterium]